MFGGPACALSDGRNYTEPSRKLAGCTPGLRTVGLFEISKACYLKPGFRTKQCLHVQSTCSGRVSMPGRHPRKMHPSLFRVRARTSQTLSWLFAASTLLEARGMWFLQVGMMQTGHGHRDSEYNFMQYCHFHSWGS